MTGRLEGRWNEMPDVLSFQLHEHHPALLYGYIRETAFADFSSCGRRQSAAGKEQR